MLFLALDRGLEIWRYDVWYIERIHGVELNLWSFYNFKIFQGVHLSFERENSSKLFPFLCVH